MSIKVELVGTKWFYIKRGTYGSVLNSAPCTGVFSEYERTAREAEANDNCPCGCGQGFFDTCNNR